MKTWIVAASLAVAGTADAGTLADALARSDAQTVKTLRADVTDVATRCTLGAVYAKRGDLSRAHVYLTGCGDVDLPTEISADIARASRDVNKKLRDSELSKIEVESTPHGLTAEISAMPGDKFTTPATIWVKGGTYEITAKSGELTYRHPVSVGDRSRTVAIIDTTVKTKKIVEPKNGNVSFEDDSATEQQVAPPPDVRRPSLLPDKYRRKVASTDATLEDPLAIHHVRHAPRTLWLGLRLGGGMFDDGTGEARVGGAVAATTRYNVASRYFLAGRFDWSRRGAGSIDVLGASAGAGATLLDGSLGVALIGQLRADVRFGDTMEVSTLGASAAANLELTLPSTPITAGVRFEQGLTDLVPGARDRALLLEVGVDWR